MEVLELPGYTEVEKLKIAQQFLVPRQLEAHGLRKSQLQFSPDALRGIIRNYTREAGVRNLEREIATICRKVATDVASGTRKAKKITGEGPARVPGAHQGPSSRWPRSRTSSAWPPAWPGRESGGDILFVEAPGVRARGG